MKATDQGLPNAMLSAGLYYLEGKEGYAKDVQKGVSLIEKAAEAGLVEAQRHAGNLYFNGVMVSMNKTRALEWYEKAVAQKDVDTEFYLGQLLASGQLQEGGGKKRGVELLRTAAAKGHEGAKAALEIFGY
jgi:TPR repeat protein